MSDRLFYPLLLLTLVALLALAAVWPQGAGLRAPGPFGHKPDKPPAIVASPAKGAHPAALPDPVAAAEAGGLR